MAEEEHSDREADQDVLLRIQEIDAQIKEAQAAGFDQEGIHHLADLIRERGRLVRRLGEIIAPP